MRKIVSPLDGLQSPLGGLTSFSVLSLFAAGETGVWYDPSDFSTMFQDSAGTTPVTAVEQPVGLILDKSKGLAVGAEIVTNGDFSNGTTGWAGTSSAVLSNPSGALVVTYNAVANPGAGGTGSVVAGAWYRVSYTLTAITGGGTVDCYVGSSNASGVLQLTAPGTKTAYVQAANTSAISIVGFGNTGSFTIDNVSVKRIDGNHASQSTAASRPVLRQDANGKYYLAFDGVDDSLATGTITPGTDKAQVWAGVRKLSDAAAGVVAELSAARSSNAGSFSLFAPSGVAANYSFITRGSVDPLSISYPANYVAPITNVLTGVGDIANDGLSMRVNGAAYASFSSDQGTGNFGSYPLYIGRRAGSTLPFNGQLYSLIARFSSANLDATTISKTETWVNSKTGAY